MRKQKMKKNNTLPAWDLSDLYKSIKDPQINKDLEAYKKNALSLQKKYKGKLEKLSAEEFLRALKLLEKNSVLGGRLGGFAYLNMSTQMKNPEAMIFYQNISEKLTDFAKPTVFFSLELNKLPETKINEWLKNKDVAFYKPFIKRVRKYKKYDEST